MHVQSSEQTQKRVHVKARARTAARGHTRRLAAEPGAAASRFSASVSTFMRSSSDLSVAVFNQNRVGRSCDTPTKTRVMAHMCAGFARRKLHQQHVQDAPISPGFQKTGTTDRKPQPPLRAIKGSGEGRINYERPLETGAGADRRTLIRDASGQRGAN